MVIKALTRKAWLNSALLAGGIGLAGVAIVSAGLLAAKHAREHEGDREDAEGVPLPHGRSSGATPHAARTALASLDHRQHSAQHHLRWHTI